MDGKPEEPPIRLVLRAIIRQGKGLSLTAEERKALREAGGL